MQRPDGHGLELLEELRRLHPRSPVVVLSGSGLSGEQLSQVDTALGKTRLDTQHVLTILARLLPAIRAALPGDVALHAPTDLSASLALLYRLPEGSRWRAESGPQAPPQRRLVPVPPSKAATLRLGLRKRDRPEPPPAGAACPAALLVSQAGSAEGSAS